VDYVWENGDLYIQDDGQMVKILDNDIVIKDPSNPSGEPTTVINKAKKQYVDNKIAKGIWE
jgi:hypothetical protein